MVTAPRVGYGITFMVTDNYGSCMPLTVGFPFEKAAATYSHKDVQSLFPVDSRYILLNPYVRYSPGQKPELYVALPKEMLTVNAGDDEVS